MKIQINTLGARVMALEKQVATLMKHHLEIIHIGAK